MTNEQKLLQVKKLMENPDFATKLSQTESIESAHQVFVDFGADVTEEDVKDIVTALSISANEEEAEETLDENELEKVSGGSFAVRLAWGALKLTWGWARRHYGSDRAVVTETVKWWKNKLFG